MHNDFDVLIIGAGAAGMLAALKLGKAGKKIAVVEAKNRVGGRIYTLHDQNFQLPVALGAEFIHGDLEPTISLLKNAGIACYDVTGDVWYHDDQQVQKQKDFMENEDLLNRHFQNLTKDISVSAFISTYLQGDDYASARSTLKNYVQGYYAADITKASTYALRDERNGNDSRQYRVEGGYAALLDALYKECLENNVLFFLSQTVQEINWNHKQVSVQSNEQLFSGHKVLITVSVGVLQNEKINFIPALPLKLAAARQLGFGPVVKIILQFQQPFWKNKELMYGKDLKKMSFLFSSASIPTWWTYYPKNVSMITGWLGGPPALEIKDLAPNTVLDRALQSLEHIFGIKRSDLMQNLMAWQVYNWTTDPCYCGAYSYDVVEGSSAKQILNTPEEEIVYFAGEGLVEGPDIGTVNGAFRSGIDAAQLIINSFKK